MLTSLGVSELIQLRMTISTVNRCKQDTTFLISGAQGGAQFRIEY
jgi:hypothetical protein